MCWDGVPDLGVSLRGVVYLTSWDVLVSMLRVSGSVLVDLAHWGVCVVVLWSVEFRVLVDEGMGLCSDPEGVQVEDVENLELLHQWFGVCLGGDSFDESDDLFLEPGKGLYV